MICCMQIKGVQVGQRVLGHLSGTQKRSSAAIKASLLPFNVRLAHTTDQGLLHTQHAVSSKPLSRLDRQRPTMEAPIRATEEYAESQNYLKKGFGVLKVFSDTSPSTL